MIHPSALMLPQASKGISKHIAQLATKDEKDIESINRMTTVHLQSLMLAYVTEIIIRNFRDDYIKAMEKSNTVNPFKVPPKQLIEIFNPTKLFKTLVDESSDFYLVLRIYLMIIS